MNALSNIDILRILHGYGITINGVVSKDLLPREIPNGWFVINLEDHDVGEGTHWTCFNKNDKGISIYFDSFGFDAPEHLHETLGDYVSNNSEIQDLGSSCCGWFCIGLIKYATSQNTSLPVAMKRYESHFARNTVLNDSRLEKLLSSVNI